MINICVPVLKRYDLLRQLVASCQSGNVKPDAYYIINNGQNHKRLMEALSDFDIDAKIKTPEKPMSVAESWNFFIKRVPEERVITNDDILFGPNSLERLLSSKADLITAHKCGFSCFVMRDSCVKKIGAANGDDGLFDETISPGYGYYEDDDYLQRLDGRGTREPVAVLEDVDCGVMHRKSSTLEVASHLERLAHHKKFKIAQQNYARKWGLEKEFEVDITRGLEAFK